MNGSDKLESVEENKKDKDWAWVISAGATLHVFLLVGTAKSFGLFFVEFLSYYDTSSSILSGMLAAQTLVLSLASLFVLNVGGKVLGNRKLILLGGVLSSLGYVMSAFAPNIIVLVLSQSVVYGIGCACTTGPVFVVLHSYFEKSLGFANSFAYVGGSIGSLVMPLIIQTLLDTYGLSGALLIVSGLILNNVIVGAVMRPFPGEQKTNESKCLLEESRIKENQNLPNKNNKSSLNEDYSLSVDNLFPKRDQRYSTEKSSYYKLLSPNLDIKRSLSESCKVGYNEYNSGHMKQLNSSARIINRLHSSRIDVYGAMSTQETFYSTHSLRSMPQISEDADSISNAEHKNELCPCQNIIDMKILRNHRLRLFLFVAFFSFCGSGMIITYIPPFAKDNGISNDKVAILVTVVGGCDLFARFTLAWITDSRIIRRNHIMGLCLGITGAATMFNPFYNSFQTFIVYSVLYGLFGSVYFSMSTLLLRDSVGSDNISPALSLMITTHGLSSTVIAPLLGFIRDLTGSYSVSFYMMGTGLLLGSVAVFCEPFVKRLEERRIQQSQGSSSDVTDIQ